MFAYTNVVTNLGIFNGIIELPYDFDEGRFFQRLISGITSVTLCRKLLEYSINFQSQVLLILFILRQNMMSHKFSFGGICDACITNDNH